VEERRAASDDKGCGGGEGEKNSCSGRREGLPLARRAAEGEAARRAVAAKVP